FDYRNLRIQPATDHSTVPPVTVDVAHTGPRRGTDVPQLRLAPPRPAAGVIQPPKQLRGYTKVAVAPGQSKQARFSIDTRALSYWDADAGDWAVAPGCYGVLVGRDSRDIVQRCTLAVGDTA